MIIANFREYVSVLRDVYSRDAMGEIGRYYQELMRSGKEVGEKKQKLKEKIVACNRQIDRQAALLRQSADKRTAGIRLAEIRRQKCELVKNLKALQQTDHFNVLSDEAKTGVCSGFLLQKYLTRELLTQNPLHFAKDNNGNLVVDCDSLRQSEIFRQAVHLRDFVAAYLLQNPDKVKTPGYFNTLLNGARGWDDVINYADSYFAARQKAADKKQNTAEASRKDVEVVHIFPEQKLQLVRLLSPEALDYESERMEHCVGHGSYDKDVTEGKSAIYSLRDLTDDGEWLPHATIEYKDGEIKQIKGFKDRPVPFPYRSTTRQAIGIICSEKDIAALYRQKKISDWKNIGFILDVNGAIRDYDNLSAPIELEKADIYDIDEKNAAFIVARQTDIRGTWTAETTKKIKKYKKIKNFNLYSMTGGIVRARKYLAETNNGGGKLFDNVSGLANLGFAKVYDEKCDNIFFIATDFPTDKQEQYVDLLNPGRNPRPVNEVILTSELARLIKPENISVRTLKITGKITPEMINTAAKFRAVGNIFFQKADFSETEKLDLSPIRNFNLQLPSTNNLNAFREEACMVAITNPQTTVTTIAKFVNNRSIRFADCKNMPAVGKIVFPSQIEHLILDAGEKPQLLNFSVFSPCKELKTLQLNKYIIKDADKTQLPENLTYLGFGGCTAKIEGKEGIIDFSRLSGIEEIRFTATDFDGVGRIVFPSLLKTCYLDSNIFQPGSILDFHLCKDMKEFDIFQFGNSRFGCRKILLPESLQKFSCSHVKADELEELNFADCRGIKELSLYHSTFPKLTRLVAPQEVYKEEKCSFGEQTKTDLIAAAPQRLTALPSAFYLADGNTRRI